MRMGSNGKLRLVKPVAPAASVDDYGVPRFAPAAQTNFTPPVGDPDTPSYPPHVCTPQELARNRYSLSGPDTGSVLPPSQAALKAPSDPWGAPKGDPDSYTAGAPVTYGNTPSYDAGPFMAAGSIRPAGDLYSTIYGSADAEGNTVGGTPPSDPAARENERRALDLAANAIGRTGDAIVAAINAGNQQDIARINQDAQIRIAEIQAQVRNSNNAQDLAVANAQIAALQQIQALTARSNQQQQNTLLYAGLAVGAVVLIAGGAAVYFATRPR